MTNREKQPKTDKLCKQYLQQLKNGELASSVSYASALQQAKLDYSEPSIKRLNTLLEQLVNKTQPNQTDYEADKHKTFFLCVVAFYIGDYIAQKTQKNIHWFSGASYFLNTQRANDLTNKFVCEINDVLINPTEFVAKKLFNKDLTSIDNFINDSVTNINKPAPTSLNEAIINNNHTSLDVKAMSMGFTAELDALTEDQLSSDMSFAKESANTNNNNTQTDKPITSSVPEGSQPINNQSVNSVDLDDMTLSDFDSQPVDKGTQDASVSSIANIQEETYHTNHSAEAVDTFEDSVGTPNSSDNEPTSTDSASKIEHTIPSNHIAKQPSIHQQNINAASKRLTQTYKNDESYEAKFNINYNSQLLGVFSVPKLPYIIATVPLALLLLVAGYYLVTGILAEEGGFPVVSCVITIILLLIIIGMWVVYRLSKVTVFDNKVSLNTPFKSQFSRFDKRVGFFHVPEKALLFGKADHIIIKSNTEVIKLKADDHDGLTELLMEVEAELLVPSLLQRLQNGETIVFSLIKLNDHMIQYGNVESKLADIGDYDIEDNFLFISKKDGSLFARIDLGSEPNMNSFLTILNELI